MAGSAGHQWKHNWIPLTPAAALIKAKGSKTTAAKLRARHGVKSSSTRDVVRASRQTSIDSGRGDRPKTKQAEIPTPDTTVAAQSRRAAIAKMSDERLAELRRTASNTQTQRFAADEQAKRAAKVRPDTSGIPLPDGYRVQQTRLSNGAPGGYEIIDPDGRRKYAGTKASEAARAARVDLVQRQQREAERQERADAVAKKKADIAAREAAAREQGAKDLKKTSPEELATYRDRQMLRDRNRYQRGSNDSTQLTNEQLEGILRDPDATPADRQRARADLEANALSDARRRLAGVADKDLPEAARRIEASNLSATEKAAARRVIAERTGGDPLEARRRELANSQTVTDGTGRVVPGPQLDPPRRPSTTLQAFQTTSAKRTSAAAAATVDRGNTVGLDGLKIGTVKKFGGIWTAYDEKGRPHPAPLKTKREAVGALVLDARARGRAR